MKEVIKLTFLAIVFVVLIIVVSWGFRYYTAEIQGQIEAKEQIQSGASRIVNYNRFFDLCAAIQGMEAGLDASYSEQERATDQKDRSRISSNITGIQTQRQRSIAQYNADARKDYTAGQFRDSNLPYQLPATDYKKGVRTSCGS